MRQVALRAAAAGLAVAMLGVVGVATARTISEPDRPSPHPTPARTPATATQPAPPPPLLDAGRPVADNPQILGWALTSIANGTVLAAHDTGATTQTASTIKTWLAGDALRRAGTQPSAHLLQLVDAAILDSDNAAATALAKDGGGAAGIRRMVTTCHLQHTRPTNQGWGYTLTTATDLAQLGACVARGDVAGPWTPLLLDRMRAVRGAGRFGPVTALTGADVATKNGWLIVDGQWQINCLAIVNLTWSLAVITRYPANLGMSHGEQLCVDVTRQLAAVPGSVAP